MAPDPLGPEAILQGMADALPAHDKGDTTSALSSSYEAIALFTHACMASLGFRLLGFNEDQKTESECSRLAPRLPARWNASFNALSFVYAHTQSSMTFVVKVDRLGGKAEIRGLAVGDERIARVEVVARDYVSSSALPLRIPLRNGGTDQEEEDRSGLPGRLQAVFVSRERIVDLASLLKVNVVQKLLPSLQKEGYEESRQGRDDDDDDDDDMPGRRRTERPRPPRDLPDPQPAQPRPYPLVDPLAAPPRRPLPAGDFPPPDFEDEYEVNRPPRGPAPPPWGAGAGRPPFNIGHDDLHPPGLGPHDPLRGSFVPGVGGGLPRPGGSGGGMHPTFDDPLFGGLRGGDEDPFDPQAPAGARWDPIGPGGLPRFGGGRGRGDQFGGGFGGFGGDII